MHDLLIFTDASVDSRTSIGYGAFLATDDINLPLAALNTQIKVKQFGNTSSTKLELETLLWTMHELFLHTEKTVRRIIYSDSQNIVKLPARRNKLEQQNYHANNGKRLNNADLYQEFYRLFDLYPSNIIKINGHSPQHKKDSIDKIFSLVDKASRFALREFNTHQKVSRCIP